MQAVKTNVMGTDNVLEAAIQNSVKRVVCLSTDKAVYPINAMGTEHVNLNCTSSLKIKLHLPLLLATSGNSHQTQRYNRHPFPSLG